MQKLLLDFLNVTEKAAISVLPLIGTGNKIAADNASTNTMRKYLNEIDMDATIAIGEGEIDEAPMLYIGEKLGKGGGELDVAVDPIDGTASVAKGEGHAITVLAAAKKGTLLHAPDMYMEKLAVGPKAKGSVDIAKPLEVNIEAVAAATGKNTSDLKILIQDRPRHQEYIDRVLGTGAKVHLFNNGDIMYSISTCVEKMGADMFIGIGGAPEGVISAVAVRCLDGDFQARLSPRNKEEKDRCKEMGISDTKDILTLDDLAGTDDCLFVATGITDNPLTKGIIKECDEIHTHSVLLNGYKKELQLIRTAHQGRSVANK